MGAHTPLCTCETYKERIFLRKVIHVEHSARACSVAAPAVLGDAHVIAVVRHIIQ